MKSLSAAAIDYTIRQEEKRLTDEEIQLEEEAKKQQREKEARQIELNIRPKVEHMTHLLNKKDLSGLKVFFIEWATQVGFSNKKWFEYFENEVLNEGNIQGFVKTVYNQWLKYCPGCHGRFKKTKFKTKKVRLNELEIRDHKEIAKALSCLD